MVKYNSVRKSREGSHMFECDERVVVLSNNFNSDFLNKGGTYETS